MELGQEWYELGLLGLFFGCFLAATVIPFSSEALFAWFVLQGYDGLSVWFLASCGNWLGGMSGYALGYYLPLERIPRWFGVKKERVKGYVSRFGDHAYWWATLCWLPVVGDAISVALGLIPTKTIPTALLMFAGKAIRYAIVFVVLAP